MRRRRLVGQTTIVALMTALNGCAPQDVGRDAPNQTLPFLEALGGNPDAGQTDGGGPENPLTMKLFVEVRDAYNLEKTIPKAMVRIVERSEKTDDQGQITLSNLVPGETLVQVDEPDYVRAAINTKLDFVHGTLRVYLHKRGPAHPITQIAPDKPITLQDGDVTVTLTPGSLMDPLGCRFTSIGSDESVNVYITRFDVSKDLPLLANPPVHIDEGTKTPLPIAVQQLVAIEVEKTVNGQDIALALAPGEKIHVSMPINQVVPSGSLRGYAQDKFSGRWMPSTLSETLNAKTWKANVSRLGMLALGIPATAIKEIKVKVQGSDKASPQYRSVMVRASNSNIAITGFTDRNGDVPFVVPETGDMSLGLLLKGSAPDIKLESPYKLTVNAECSKAGEFDAAKKLYCNGFTWVKAGSSNAVAHQNEVGSRCGTGNDGICALGIVTVVSEKHICDSLFDSEAKKKDGIEYCNGIDDDCDGKIDEEELDHKLEGVGVACDDDGATGITICNSFGAIVCQSNQMSAEILGDGVDNDKNGLIDDECVPGQKKSCYHGAPETADIAPCKSGQQTCDELGKWETNCAGEVLPQAETCNDKDDDCNGQTDENLGATSCGVGACATTVQNCVNGQSQTCAPLPQGTETCNNIDDDCDGQTDENLGATSCGVGACVTTVPNCINGESQTCAPLPQGTETCNNVDDDCDGQTDENLGATSCGVGACATTVQNCFNGLPQTCAPLPQGTETCNNVDDDCDGQTDDNPATVGDSCSTGLNGVCQAGTKVCNNGAISCSQTTQSAPEVCDGKDNDCDGTIDDNPATVGDACSTGLNGVCQAGTKVCNNGSISCSQTTQSGPEVCDGLDNDCDGTIDDTPATVGDSCSTGLNGACQAGTKVCNNGAISCSQTTQSSAEKCNNIDDDCNGQTDDNPLCADVCLANCPGGTPDGVCAVGENSFTCAQDCACGDGICSGNETTQNCHVDCKFSSDLNGMCGNGHCDPWEVNYAQATILCHPDCWDGVVLAGATCGNGTCTTDETPANCAADCGNLTSYINGDSNCDPGEHWSTSIDCAKNIDAGTFLKAECVPNTYTLEETYADGFGGTTTRTVTTCSESCGAAPWKLLTANPNYTDYNGNTVLRPDCSICTITSAPLPSIVGDAGVGWGGWVSVYNQSTYEMDQDPNKCDLAIHPYKPSSPFHYYAVPLEWEKVADKDCSVTQCTVRDCAGNSYPQDYGTVGVWKPAYASWSKLAAYCN